MSSNSINETNQQSGVCLPSVTLQDPRLSCRDLGVLTVLLFRTGGKALTAKDIAAQSESREGREAIRNCLRKLEDAGYIQTTRLSDQQGRWRMHRTIYATSQLHDPSHDNTSTPPTPENPYVGSPGAGSLGAKSKSFASKSTSLSCNASARGSAKKKPTLMLGICCWNARDEQRVSTLRSQHGDEAITAAVAGWKPPTATGQAGSQRTTPLPSEVEKILKSSTGVHDGSRQQSNSGSPEGNLLAYYLDSADEQGCTAGS